MSPGPVSSVPSNEPRRSEQPRKRPTILSDYVCNTMAPKDPLTTSTTSKRASSDTRYPILNYITYDKFSVSHQQFLAAITKIVEPRYYKEAIHDPLWRKVMADEIRALEDNKNGF